jgi:formate hydrogenlyase subunit 3/multisubunit Na+/H+ antiporter MnhD subunit
MLLLFPLASLIGVPPLWGAGLRLLQFTAAWNLPQPAPNDTLELHQGLLALLGLALAAWVFLAGSLLTVFRTVWWEPALTTWDAQRSRWNWGLAVVATATIACAGAGLLLLR